MTISSSADQSFPPEIRLRAGSDYRRVYDRRCRVSDSRLTLCGCENKLEVPRLGLSVSRKVGSAVVRNRWKRLVREAFRLERNQWPRGVDFVVIPRVAEPPPLVELRAALRALARRLVSRLAKPPA